MRLNRAVDNHGEFHDVIGYFRLLVDQTRDSHRYQDSTTVEIANPDVKEIVAHAMG